MSEEANRAWKDQYMLRMPDGLRDRIKAAAEFNGRSMNAEIIRVLEKEFPDYLADENFGSFFVMMIRAEIEAKTKAEKAEAWNKLRTAVERRYPGKTVKRGFLGVPNIVDAPASNDSSRAEVRDDR